MRARRRRSPRCSAAALLFLGACTFVASMWARADASAVQASVRSSARASIAQDVCARLSARLENAPWDPAAEAKAVDAPSQAPRRTAWVIATNALAPVWAAPKTAAIVGRLQAGAVLAARRTNTPCTEGRRRGRWLQLDGGWVCDAEGVRFVARSEAPRSSLPVAYRKVAVDGLPLFARLPSAAELAAADRAQAAGAKMPAPVLDVARGAYWLSLDGTTETIGDRTFARTLAGAWVEARFEDRAMPSFSGVDLEATAATLPLAWVHRAEGAPLHVREADGAFVACGALPKHARLKVVREVAGPNGERWVEAEGGVWVHRDAVRIARTQTPPSRALARQRWVHFDLDEQTFVAYEGRRPVYASLVSSGKGRYRTPTGLFRVTRKYRTKTMIGPDPDVGKYHIEDVPWTHFYKRGYAVHGAYWHEELGNVRSHGCTNLAPADARWLFAWSTPDVPDGWHAVIDGEGTWFSFTRGSAR